jgi:hypothetical protein
MDNKTVNKNCGFAGTPKSLLNNIMRSVSSYNNIIDKKKKEKMREPKKINKLLQSKSDNIKGKNKYKIGKTSYKNNLMEREKNLQMKLLSKIENATADV